MHELAGRAYNIFNMKVERKTLGSHLTPFGKKLAELCIRAKITVEDLRQALPEDDQSAEWLERAQTDLRAIKAIKEQNGEDDVITMAARAWTDEYFKKNPDSPYSRKRILRGVSKELQKALNEAA